MSVPDDRWRSRFSLDQVRFIDERCDQFEKEWNALLAPRIEDYLGDTQGQVRITLWLELALVDQALRQGQGETVAIAEYQERCPDKAVLLDVSSCQMPAYASPTSADGPEIDSVADAGSGAPVADLLAHPDNDDATEPPGDPIADPSLTTAGSADAPTVPHNLPSTLGLAGDADAGRHEGLACAQPGAIVGDYILIDELAQGGMGVVFMARQKTLDRIVALKTIKTGILAGDRELRLFKSEAEAVARLDHPNIVPILEVGQHGGLHYYSMKLVRGRTAQDSLTRFKDRPAAIARLVERIADAIHHAHQRGVLHRDLKPSNILVDIQGVPHVIDFGLAKRLGADGESTAGSAAAGTPSYMSPEQAEGRGDAITMATDVYGLGTILYALLAGRPPFQASSTAETLRQVVNQEPRRPRAIDPRIDRDLETICLKCLEKAPKDRYATARELAEDLNRWLAGKPILARPASTAERIAKFIRRHPAGSFLVGLLALALAAGGGGIVWQWRRAVDARGKLAEALNASRRNEDEALRGEDLARHLAYAAKLTLANRDWQDANVTQVRRQLDETIPPPRRSDLRNFEWSYLDRLSRTQVLTLKGHEESIVSVAYSPDGKTLASASEDRTIKLWDTVTGQPIRTLVATRAVRKAVFHPDGSRLASAGVDRKVTLWDVGTGQVIRTFPHDGSIEFLEYSPDGKALAFSSRDGTIRLLDSENGAPIRTFQDHRDGEYSGIVFSPDGKAIISGGGFKPTIRIWDVATGKVAGTLKDDGGTLALSPDGKALASSFRDGTIRLWDIAKGSVAAAFTDRSNRGAVRDLAFSPDGKTVASTAEIGQALTLWEVPTGRVLRTIKGHTGTIMDFAFSPDGIHLASASNDLTVRIWDTTRDQEARTLPEPEEIMDVAFGPDGSYLAAACKDRTVKLWDVAAGRVVRTFRGHTAGVKAVAIARDGRRAASAGNDLIVRIWDVATGREIKALEGHKAVIWAVAFSPDGKAVASGGDDQSVKIWDPDAGREIHDLKGHIGQVNAVEFSPDGKTLASGDFEGFIIFWDPDTGRRIRAFKADADGICTIAFSHDGKWLASGGYDRSIKIWDAATGREDRTLTGHASRVQHLAFSHDDKRLVSAGSDSTVRIWDPAFGQELLILRGHTGIVWGVAFSPDGSRVASGSSDHTVKLWEADTGRAPR